MPKIQDIINDLNISRAELAAAYKSAIGKTLSARAVNIKDEELVLVQKELSNISSPKTAAKKTAKAVKEPKTSEKDDAKVLKGDELFGGDDFLSGLGFGPKKEEEIAEEEAEEPAIKESEPADEMKVSFGNARVIISAPLDERKENFKRKERADRQPQERKTFERREPQKSESAGKTFHTFSNTSFSQGTYRNRQDNRRPSAGSNQGRQETTPAQTAPAAPKVVKEAWVSGNLVKKQEIIIGDSITVKEFSEKMGVQLPELIKKFLQNKIMVNINSSIDFDTANIIGEEFGVKVKKEATNISVEDVMEGNISAILEADKEAEHKMKRPPVVTIMGHVDHGKTKLLDYLRKTNVVSGEAGGITQSIGASQILHNGEKITFIDTPWHELFTSLRARGAKITNIVIIVIAADDGIKQQTIEAINHAKDANVPIIVAITKIDKGMGNIDMIKWQLAEHGLTVEDRGGNVPVVPVSAMTGQGIDDLLETITLHAEMLELQYDPSRNGVGVVLEATKDSKQWVLTTLLLLTGKLNVGDIIMVHNTYGKVKKMLDRTGKETKHVEGGDPVMILGLSEVPEAWRVAEVTANERDAQAKIAKIVEKERANQWDNALAQLMSKIQSGDTVQLNIIVKADSFGSLEAAKYAIQSITPPENLSIKIVHADVGNFGESDLSLAQASGAIMLGFNTSINAALAKKAEQMKLTMKNYEIIYEMTDYIENILKGMVVVEEKEVYLGKLNVLGVFYKKEKDMIIGGKVIDGEIRNGASFRIMRGEGEEAEIYTQGKVISLKREQENVDKVAVGYECGMKVRVGKKIAEGDILEFYVME